jgi:hypothetical protein
MLRLVKGDGACGTQRIHREDYMRRLLLLSGMTLAGLLAVAGPAAAHDDAVVCDGNAKGLTVNGSLTVPEGGACVLDDSTVRGDVKVRAGGYFEGSNTNVRGDVKGKRAQTIFLEGGSSVRGDVKGDRTSQVFVFASYVGGEIDVQRADNKVNVCGNTVQGDINVERSQRDILVGDPDAVDCPGNTVRRGDIEVEDNFTDVELVVRGNTISRGDLEVKRNTGPSDKFVEDNTGGDRLDCKGNSDLFVASDNTGWKKITGQCD